MIRQSYLVCSAGLLLAIAACDQSTGLSTGISQSDANQLAADMDAVSTLGTADVGLGASFSIVTDGSGSALLRHRFQSTISSPSRSSAQRAGKS